MLCNYGRKEARKSHIDCYAPHAIIPTVLMPLKVRADRSRVVPITPRVNPRVDPGLTSLGVGPTDPPTQGKHYGPEIQRIPGPPQDVRTLVCTSDARPEVFFFCAPGTRGKTSAQGITPPDYPPFTASFGQGERPINNT